VLAVEAQEQADVLLCADEDLIHCEYKLLAVDITQKGTVWEC